MKTKPNAEIEFIRRQKFVDRPKHLCTLPAVQSWNRLSGRRVLSFLFLYGPMISDAWGEVMFCFVFTGGGS